MNFGNGDASDGMVRTVKDSLLIRGKLLCNLGRSIYTRGGHLSSNLQDDVSGRQL